MEQICLKCAYRIPMADGEFVCDNEESEGYGVSVTGDDGCVCFQEKEIEDGKIL